MTKQITEEQALQAFALWVMAKTRQEEARAFEMQMCLVVGIEDGGHLSDAVYQTGATQRRAFDTALAKEGVVVGSSQ